MYIWGRRTDYICVSFSTISHPDMGSIISIVGRRSALPHWQSTSWQNKELDSANRKQVFTSRTVRWHSPLGGMFLYIAEYKVKYLFDLYSLILAGLLVWQSSTSLTRHYYFRYSPLVAAHSVLALYLPQEYRVLVVCLAYSSSNLFAIQYVQLFLLYASLLKKRCCSYCQCIFTLATKNLGIYTKWGSGLIVMVR